MDNALVDRDKWIVIASLASVGLAAFGAALGQGRAVAAALEGMTRNPSGVDQSLKPLIIGLALLESLVIYVVVIALMYYPKVH
jgi:F-type H+-transporting ATPase subunit c